ncbi:hypothetical protein HK26_08155 [Acetobacter okinawensis]|uniref:Uncharacterized protein n=1 Tax=Acetobacter okinawensis TaxID=1076594 RepID=A0A252BRU0_9PROT|nr:hypothetical protein HK26_08155 [Acetobacter okinawensis]
MRRACGWLDGFVGGFCAGLMAAKPPYNRLYATGLARGHYVPGKATAFPTTWRLGGAAASLHAVRGAVCHSVLSRCFVWF